MTVGILVLARSIGIVAGGILARGFCLRRILGSFLATLSTCCFISTPVLAFFAFSNLVIMTACMCSIFIRLFGAFTRPFCATQANIFNC
jgi:hypothetical protein